MEQSPEILMVLNSLNKEKRELLDKVGEIDKVIKRIKYGNLKLGLSQGIAIVAFFLKTSLFHLQEC